MNSAAAISTDVIRHSPLDQLLLLQIECGDDFIAALFGGQNLLDKMRRKKFSFRVRARAEFSRGILQVELGAVVPIVLRSVKRAIVAARIQSAPRRALRNNAQRNRFRSGQMGCGFAKINLTGRANAFNVAPIRCEIQIRFQDLGFRVMALEFERAHDLSKLPGWRPGLEMKTQTRQLHRNCRRSGTRATVQQAISRAQQSDRIHARVAREIFVFISKSCVDQLRRNLGQRSPNPKFLVRREGDAKQFAIAIAHALRK